MDTIKHIKLTESQALRLLRLAYSENEELVVQVQELQAKIDDNNALIKQLEGQSANGQGVTTDAINGNDETKNIAEEDIDEEYDISWSLSKRITYVIKENVRPLLSAEIVNGIIAKNPAAYPDEEAKRKLSVSVYAALNTKYNNGSLSRRNTPSGYKYQINEKKEHA